MRSIDADVLEKEGWSLYRTVRLDRHALEYQVKPIAKVPTIDPARKGKWIRISCDDEIYKCSECGNVVNTNDIDENKYCYRCGCRMEEGEQK